MMKRSLLLICSLLALNYTYAQKNPVAGFIVTNEGETINGTVDILSNVSNGKECHFCAAGSQEYRTYQPGSIRNYGTSDGGLLYESLRVPYDGSAPVQLRAQATKPNLYRIALRVSLPSLTRLLPTSQVQSC